MASPDANGLSSAERPSAALTSPPGPGLQVATTIVDVRLRDDEPAEMVRILAPRPGGPVAAIRVSPEVTLLADDPLVLDALIAAGIQAQARLTAARATNRQVDVLDPR